MKYSREHTYNGHSDYQDALIKKFVEKDINLTIMPSPLDPVNTATVLTKDHLGVTHVHMCGNHEHDFNTLCTEMNEFLSRAHLFFFGYEFDGAIE